jgi:hypothetical protein
VSTVRLAGLIAARNLRNVIRIPGNVFTVVGTPLLVLVTFSGAFDRVTSLPGFPTASALTWITPYAVAIGATFSGLGTASNVERDRATGFLDRLSTGQVPAAYQAGWLAFVSRRNPLSPILATARAGFLGPVSWQAAGPGLITLAIIAVVLAVGAAAALTGARRGDPRGVSQPEDGPVHATDHMVGDLLDGLPGS